MNNSIVQRNSSFSTLRNNIEYSEGGEKINSSFSTLRNDTEYSEGGEKIWKNGHDTNTDLFAAVTGAIPMIPLKGPVG